LQTVAQLIRFWVKSSSEEPSPNSAQKLKVEERLWHVKSGRAAGKSHAATELNRELNKINLLIHSRYNELLKRNGKATAQEVKNAFQGIASEQVTLLPSTMK
jgi:succinate dehydrogenase/fumarate reductase flavoprotein subunit